MVTAPAHLVLDIGNTHTAWGVSVAGQAVETGNLPTAAFVENPEALLAQLAGHCKGHLSSVANVSFCSVVPAATKALKGVLGNLNNAGAAPLYKGAALFELTHNNCAPLNVDYPKPETIGPDRLASALGALAYLGGVQHAGNLKNNDKHNNENLSAEHNATNASTPVHSTSTPMATGPVLALDLGTAITLDYVCAENIYRGGLIAPGLSLMTEYLHQRTALLPKVNTQDILAGAGTHAAYGTSTEAAMHLGASAGYIGLVQGLVQHVQQHLNAPTPPALVATGGSATALLAKAFGPGNIHIVPNLALKGLLALQT